MFHNRYVFCFTLINLINSAPQINLYYTDWVSGNDDDQLQHNCLRFADSNQNSEVRTLTSYCMTELPLKLTIEKNNSFPKFNFAELSKRNITSQQLYLWSAPIDIIERYQFYLDQLPTSFQDLNMTTDIFYNCTLPRFGPMCQYELEYYHSDYSFLYEIIRSFYKTYPYQPTNLTCYTHLQCNRGPSPSCLDWTEICDGQVDCLDGGLDGEHCWQLEINECNDNEFRCANGQCILKAFYGDAEGDTYDCIDGSDQLDRTSVSNHLCEDMAMSFRCEDIACKRNGLTSSCITERTHLLIQAMFSIKNESISDQCWSAFKCIMYIYKFNDPTCIDVCSDDKCIQIIKSECPDTMVIPAVPALFGHIYFAYQKNASEIFRYGKLQYLYTCYNNSYYDDQYPTGSKILINNLICYRNTFHPSFWKTTHPSQQPTMFDVYKDLWKYYHIFNYTSTLCNRSNMYQCTNSIKCISSYRRNNRIDDCPRSDDENIADIVDIDSANPFWSLSIYSFERDKRRIEYIRKNISFQTICDGYTQLLPINIHGKNETDETECEQWECNNIYTGCNGVWNCLNGADERNCDSSLQSDCSSDDHICVSPDTNQLICLPIEKANDGNVDCLGGTDEPALCRKKYEFEYPDNFYCKDTVPIKCINGEKLCDGTDDCKHGDDEKFCEDISTDDYDGDISDYCNSRKSTMRTDVDKVLCQSLRLRVRDPFVFFSHVKPGTFFGDLLKNVENRAFLSAIPRQYQPRCHHGLDLRIWLNAKNYLLTCLCPPNFYGDTCQYQNQRVILAVRFRAFSSSWQTVFAIVVSLIDDSDQRIVHSYEQFTYLSIRDCLNKFNVYLLYSTRPKNQTKHYVIHIDMYEKASLTYRGSLLVPITFSFLPVHHLTFIADIPRRKDQIEKCSDHQCIYGICTKYFNNKKNVGFCHCDQGWTGRYCTIPYNCTCSSESLCIGISANNRSICVCRPNRFGPRCLINTVCQIDNNSACKNGGQCIPGDEYTGLQQPFTCKCLNGFFGDRCEREENSLRLSFTKDIILSQSIFIHFIRIMYEIPPIRATIFATIPIEQNSLTIYWSQPFHIVFIELPVNNYYLMVIQITYRRSSIIKKMIKPADRCQHISEIFNETFLQWHPLRQIKYYHLACQKQSLNLSCFYDNVHLCLCYDYHQKRLANCFEFQHNMTMDCLGKSECENGGQCFQDHPDCPKRSMCFCPPCFYGTLCQFRTSGFGLSLDAILGYHIRSDINILHQPTIVQISVTLSIIFMIVGFINGILSMITFKNKTIQEVGCGLYLFGSSITTLFIMNLFGLKFWILLISGMGSISNKLFLSVQCRSLDFLLRVCLNMEQWLNACVATERAYTAIKGANFNKKKSKQVARLVIVIVLIVNVSTSIHDPIYRRLIEEENDDNNENRIWCIVTYSNSLQVFNSAVYIFHFFGPFIINLLSAIILITRKTRQQLKLQTAGNFKVILRKQFREHKHLLTAPILLVILAVPRLIISFVSKCMKSADDSWIFLFAYFISFIPPTLTFVIFILPSTFYKKEFHKIIIRYRTNIQRWLHIIP